jgi:hypothetical protein
MKDVEMTEYSKGDNDNSVAVAAAKANASQISGIPTDTQIARFRLAMAMFSLGFLSLALIASFQSGPNVPWYLAVSSGMGLMYFLATAFAREIKLEQFAHL